MPRPTLLAIDIDGTLLDPTGTLRDATRDAVHRAEDAGIFVMLATGRGLVECRRFAEALGFLDRRPAGEPVPIAVAGGAIVSDLRSGRTLHRFSMPPDLVADATGVMLERGHASLVLKDPDAAGFDYLVVTGEQEVAIDPVTVWWFNELKVEARFARTLADDGHPEQTVRVGACARAEEGEALFNELKQRLGDRATFHSFSAVVAPDSVRLGEDKRPFTIVEVFNPHAGKLAAVNWVCGSRGLDHALTAAVGDEMNDLDMIAGVGLGVAMGNGAPAVRDIADAITETNADDGLARAIDRIISGEWSIKPDAASASTQV